MRRALLRRWWPRLATVVVLGALAVVGWRALDRGAMPQLFDDDRPVTAAEPVLKQAEAAVWLLVRVQHGVAATPRRCYFTARKDPATPADHATGTGSGTYQLAGRVLCGPVLFVDSDPQKAFLSFPLSSAVVAGHAQLSVLTTHPESVAGPSAGEMLIRPDGRKPPQARPAIPQPPPAAVDLLSATSTVTPSLTAAPKNAAIIGPSSGVALRSYGFVRRFGVGPDARSAPQGRRLLAFAIRQLPGEFASETPKLAIEVDGLVRGPLIVAPDYVVTAVPTTARQIDLILTDAGTTQRLSLITALPASSNPLVSSRPDRATSLANVQSVTVRVARAGKSGLVSGTISFRSVWLSYWGADGSEPGGLTRAFLHVTASVRLAGDPQAYGAEAGLLSASVPGAPAVGARNAAKSPKSEVDDVIEVPATLTSGSIRYAGRITAGGTTLTVLTPVTVRFLLPS